MMTLVNDIWFDNVIGKPKNYDGVGSDYIPAHIHQFIMGKNSDNIPIVVCKLCKNSRMYIMLIQKNRLDIH